MTGGVIDMWSLGNADAALGNAYARIIVDEAAIIDRHGDLLYQWQKNIRPMLTDYLGDAYFLSVPKGTNDFYQLWLMGRPESNSYDPDWRSWQMPTSNNPYIAKSEIEKAKKDLPEYLFQQEYLAWFIDTPGGLIFDTWLDNGSPDCNVTEDAEYIPDGGMVIWGVDDGYVGEVDKSTGFPTGNSHPRVILFGQLRRNGQLVVFDEHWALQELEDAHIKAALNKNGEPEYVAVDSSAATLKGHFHANLIQTMNGSHPVEEGIKALRSALAPDHNGFRQILVHPRCKMLRYEMSKYARDQNGKIIKKYDHAVDALRYLFHSLG